MSINDIKKLIKSNPDLKIRELIINKVKIYIFFFESLTNSNDINDYILKPILYENINTINSIKTKLPFNNYIDITKKEELLYTLYSGFCIICIKKDYVAFETKYSLDSGINEASNEKVIKGPKDAFTENYQINLGLIRKRIKSKYLKVNEFIVGKSSKTKVSLIYIKNITNKEIISRIKKRINNIDIDYLANSNYISELLHENKTIFPTSIMTERPDLVSFSLMEGRCALLIENSPQVLIMPAFLADNLKSVDDYYQNSKNVSITRIIRIISFIVAIVTPGFYIALTTFNQETLPTTLLINFSMQREGVPFPSSVEAFILWLIFEILREADTRVPFVVGSSMSIVGALVLGQAAVDAGMISPIMIIIIAISSVASFLFNDNDIVNAIRIWKLVFLLLGSFVGLYGIFIASILFLIRICSIDSLGFDYTYPFAPFNLKEQKNNLLLNNNYKLYKRNSILTKNTNRR